MQKQYQMVETYSSSIIENASDAILVASENEGIRIFNLAAEKLFGLNKYEALGSAIDSMLPSQFSDLLLSSSNSGKTVPANLHPISFDHPTGRQHLLLSVNFFPDTERVENTILVCHDMTRIKTLEAQVRQRARL